MIDLLLLGLLIVAGVIGSIVFIRFLGWILGALFAVAAIFIGIASLGYVGSIFF